MNGKVEFAPVAPLGMLQKLSDENLLGNYLLVLAHDIVDDPMGWESFRIRHPDVFIILDNSLCELGYPAPDDMMVEADRIIRPNCIVLPDYLGDRKLTCSAAKTAYLRWMDLMTTPFMLCVQGSSRADVKQCVEEMRNPWFGRIEYWALPRHMTKLMGSRGPLLRMMVDMGLTNIHLMGFSDDIQDDLATARMCRDHVMGIDSAVPLRSGMQAVYMSQNPGYDPGLRGDYWRVANEIPVDNKIAANIKWIRGQINA